MLSIIIPCYNEAKRLKEQELFILSKQKDVTVFLANDGSVDNTSKIITEFSKKFPNVFDIQFLKNEGKATTIFKVIQLLKEDKNNQYIGYLDADFATNAHQYLKMYNHLQNSKKEYVFGSRISTLSSNIERDSKRHYIGRIVITLLNFKYKLGIYDTQCGAKIFSKKCIEKISETPFFTKWLFDIEIFLRLRKCNLMNTGIEFPLDNWKDVKGSKLSIREVKNIFNDFYKLFKFY